MKYIVLALAVVTGCDATETTSEALRRSELAHGAPAASEPEPSAPIRPIEAEVTLAPATPPPVRLDMLCGPIATATCRTHLGCRSGVSRELMLACEAHITAACEAERPALEARIAADRLRFDANAWRDCRARMDLVGCAPPAEMQAALGGGCDGVLVGRIASGGACSEAGDCAPGLACTTANGQCPGVCAPLGTHGAACDATFVPCAEGLTCESGRCEPEQVSIGAACVVSAQCPANSFCDDDLGACVATRARGKACDDDEQCAASDFCQFADLGDDVVLEVGACAQRLPPYAACNPLIGGCVEGFACDDARGECVVIPDSAGAPCVADVAPCGEGTGLVCDATLCELEPFVGDVCDPAGAPCRFGFCAATDASGVGTCEAFLAPAATCSDDAQCGALACVDGRCARDATRCVATRHDINLGFRYRIR